MIYSNCIGVWYPLICNEIYFVPFTNSPFSCLDRINKTILYVFPSYGYYFLGSMITAWFLVLVGKDLSPSYLGFFKDLQARLDRVSLFLNSHLLVLVPSWNLYW